MTPAPLRFALPLLLLLLLLATVTAAEEPFTPNATQPPVQHPMIAPSVGQGNCATCHGNYDFSANYEPFPTWAGSPMAHSTRDPLFWAALDVANEDIPGVGEFCLRCHAPKAWLEGRATAGNGAIGDADGCSLEGNLDQAGQDFSGVSCHFCHRMKTENPPPTGEQSQYFENAQAWIDDEVCTDSGAGAPQGPCRRGPFGYGIVANAPPHEYAYSALHLSSELCATCHNVTSPSESLISGGIDLGIPFPIERTFKEWQQSDFGNQAKADFATCQDCHMGTVTHNPAYASSRGFPNRSGVMKHHTFAGGNPWLPTVLAGEMGPELGRTNELLIAANAAEAMLQSAATVEVDASAGLNGSNQLPFTVRVTNLSGHKLPTGYSEGRRMWLHVEARNASDQIVWQSGAYNAITGVLTMDSQVQIWERINGIWDSGQCSNIEGGKEAFHFVLENCIKKDNRIPPKGFLGKLDPETRPVGAVYPEASPGVLAHWDDVEYLVPAGVAGSVETVTATLLFQPTRKEYVEFLRDSAIAGGYPDDCIPRSTGALGQTRGEYVYDLWVEYGRAAPTTMAVDVAIPGEVFSDDFESGDSDAWSTTVGG